MRCECVELATPAELQHAIGVMARKPQPARWSIDGLDDVVGDGPWRIYRAHPLTIEVRSQATRRGKPVARREPADFRAGH